MACCENYPHPTMAPGQEPYTCDELRANAALIKMAAEEDPGEENEPMVRAHDGDFLDDLWDDEADLSTEIPDELTVEDKVPCPVCGAVIGHAEHCLMSAMLDQKRQASPSESMATRQALLKAMQNVACLSEGEATACLRDWQEGRPYSGEAVNHYGGTDQVINRAIVYMVRTLNLLADERI